MIKSNLKIHSEHARSPNLSTILMVEEAIRSYRHDSVASLKKRLPKKVMHQTLKVILDYLWKSGKINYTPKGIEWIHKEPEHAREIHMDYFG